MDEAMYADLQRPRANDVTIRRAAGRHLAMRRWLVLALNLATVAVLIALMARLLGAGGWTWSERLMVVAFAVTLPWLSLGFWNAVIGFLILRLSADPSGLVTPAIRRVGPADPVTLRTAIVMTLRNEDAGRAVARLRAIESSLEATGWSACFEYHLLSDSSCPRIAAEEERCLDNWRQASRHPERIHYRRRAENIGYKAGNLWEFCLRCADGYDLFVPLDADSLMSGPAILRLVRVMQVSPEIGILQGLVVGLPARSLFARLFQFGMRQGMRSYTTGSAWWQGDCGPFWGHNAVVRLRPFRDHCALPVLPGAPPLGGHILSHDQVEAVLMRRAGYEVRVLAEEDESWEENPAALPDFIKRDLRWCQGNMQYWGLLAMPGLAPLSRVQLLLAILMYIGAPGWMAFILLGLADLALSPEREAFPMSLGVSLLATVVAMSLAPKLLGLLDLLLSAEGRRRYGGPKRVLAGAVSEALFSSLLAPVVSFAQTRFMLGLAAGRRITWEAQRRDGARVTLAEAWRGLWPQTLFGLLILAVLIAVAPVLIGFAAPVLIGFIGAAPLAHLSASPRLGRLAVAVGLCDVPEDRRRPAIIAMVDDPGGRRSIGAAAAEADRSLAA